MHNYTFSFCIVNSFCELAPSLIHTSGHYLLSEVFSQDPLERYFSKQRHRGGGNENPTIEQFQSNAAILTQQQQTRHELKTMNVQPANFDESSSQRCVDEPLLKRARKH